MATRGKIASARSLGVVSAFQERNHSAVRGRKTGSDSGRAKDNVIVTNQILEILDKTPERSVRRTPVSKGQRGSFVDP